MDDMNGRMAALKDIYGKANNFRMAHKKKKPDMANMSYEDWQAHKQGMESEGEPLLTISILSGSGKLPNDDATELVDNPEEDKLEQQSGY